MGISSSRSRPGLAVVLATLALGLPAGPTVAALGQAPGRLTIDRLYSLPRIIGTAPDDVSWSPDSTRVAFLWNAEGTNFRDVWMATVDDNEPFRLTRFPRPPRSDAGTDVDAILRNERADQAAGVTSVEWFPDGRSLLVGIGPEWYRVVPGAEPERLPLSGGQASFSPDGQWLGLVREGALWVVPATSVASGTPHETAAAATLGGRLSRYMWSPAGPQVAAVVRDLSGVPERLIPDYLGEETSVSRIRRPFPGEEPGRSRLVVLDVDSGASRAMDIGPDDRDLIFTVQWSGDGERLLVDTSDLFVKDRRLLSVDAASGAATLLYGESDPANVMAFWQAAWAPDGEAALLLSDRDGFYHLYEVSRDAAPRALTAGDWEVESFHVGTDAIWLVTNRGRPEERHLDRVPLEGGPLQRLSARAGTHAPTFSPDGRWAAVLFSSDQVPPDLFLNRLDEPGEERVTNSPLPEFSEHRWVTAEYVSFPSHVDGATIHGRLMVPLDFDPSRRYPAIIGSIYSGTLRNQWGGRTAHPLWGLDQVLLQEGYVLLNIDIRGSWGHGREFRSRMQQDYGGIDTEDIYSGVKYLESLAYVDMGRVGLWGSSYGGLMTVMSLFKRPGVFAAGVAGAPATNVWHATTGEMRVMGRPEDHPDAYARSSAFTWAAGLEDPLMIIHGMRDRIVLFKDSVTLLQNLMLLGKGHLVDFVPVPDSEHGWDAAELYQTRYAFAKLVGHFNRHLKADPR